MRPVILFSLMMLVAAASAFNLGQYLAVNESNATITKEFFNLDHTVYYIINISGVPSFLIKGDDPVLDEAEMTSVIKQYYGTKYSVSGNDTGLLRGYFLSYNYSLNNGGRFPGQEMLACKKALFLTMIPCVDDASCNKSARFFCAGYAQAIGCNDPNSVLQPLKDYSYSSDGTEALMADIFDKLDTMNPDNAVDYISQMQKDIPLLQNYKTKMESTIFRMPAVGQKCTNCYGLCPDISMDGTALNNAGSALASISTKIAPLAGFESAAGIIYDNTQLRLSENSNSNLRLYYISIYNPINTQAKLVRNRTIQALSLVDNSTVRAKVAQLDALSELINASIASNNFTDINASLADYSAAVKLLNTTAEPLLAVYNNVSTAYKSATVYLFMVEGETLSPEDMAKYAVIKQKKIQLDTQFKEGLTATQYKDIQSQYTSLITDEKALVGRVGPEQALYMFTGMSNKFVDALDVLLSQTRPLSYTERVSVSGYMPAATSIMLFLSFSSLVVFLFLVYYALAHKPMGKALLVVLSLFLIFLVALVSIGIFLSLNRSLDSMKYSDFVDLLKYSKNATVVLQKNGADSGTLASMRSCAASITGALTQGKVASTYYELSGQSCTVNGTVIADCLDKNANPVIMLNASLVDSSQYSGLLTKQANFGGDKQYYDTCPFAESFRVS